MWLQAPNISCIHGFSTRHGGVSPSPFDSLNLGGSEDSQDNIRQNRSMALKGLGLAPSMLCNLKQVHGSHVCIAKKGIQEGDALVTDQNGLALAISIADCYPVLFHDPKNRVIGAAHAGWRGTAAGIVTNTVHRMQELGADIRHLEVAIGQGICQEHFEVGDEVIAHFEAKGFPSSCWKNKRIDLNLCNRFLLEKAGVAASTIWSMERCTFDEDFFSYRRDKGNTGRMWAVICMKA